MASAEFPASDSEKLICPVGVVDYTKKTDYKFAPKASRRPSQSFTTNSRERHGVFASPRVNSTPLAAYSAKSASASSTLRYASSSSSAYLSGLAVGGAAQRKDWKSTRLNSSHQIISYAVFCLKKKKPRASLVLMRELVH